MLDALTAPDALENFRLFGLQIGRNENGDRLANGLFRRIAEQTLRARIPADDDAVEVFADDRVVGRLDDTGELPPRLLAAALFGDVEERRDPAAYLAFGIELGAVGDEESACSQIWEFDVAFEIRGLAAQHPLGIGPQRVVALGAEHLADGPADNVFAAAADQMRVGLADKAVTEVAAAPHQHEWRAIDDRLQFRFAAAQDFFGALALGKLLKAADRALDAA